MPREYRDRGIDVNVRAHAQRREYELIADRIARTTLGPVLDWGCGHGQVTALLRERGVDSVPFDYKSGLTGVHTEALSRYPGVEAIVSGDPVALPFSTGCFTAVLSLGVLEHVQDPDGSLEELRRVLRPGGMLYVYKLPNRWSYLEWVARRMGLWHHGVGTYDRLYQITTACALVLRHGFAVREVRRANMLPLTLTRPSRPAFHEALWRANRLIDRVPGLNLLATNVELVAVAPH